MVLEDKKGLLTINSIPRNLLPTYFLKKLAVNLLHNP